MNTRTLLSATLAAFLAAALQPVLAEGPKPIESEDAAAPDPAAMEAWMATMNTVAVRQRKAYENLKASASPRDWAVASQITVHDFDVDRNGKPGFDEEKFRKTKAERAELLRNAAAGAPADTLIQWLALHEMPHTGQGCASSKPPVDRVEAVKNLEPDNAFAWLPDLKAATDAKDAFAIDQALARMAASKRFDNHVVDYTIALVDVARRYPDVIGTPLAEASSDIEPEDAAAISAFIMGRMTGMHQSHFGDVCDVTKQLDADLRRFAACGDLGRRLSREAATLDLRKAGFDLLRESAQLSDDDAAAERELMWLPHQLQEVLGGDQEKWTSAMLEGKALWLEKRDDVVVIKSLLESRGVSPTPPPGWMPEREGDTAR